MSESQRKFEANAFYLQNAVVQSRPGNGANGPIKPASSELPEGEGHVRSSTFSRETILRLIQILKDK